MKRTRTGTRHAKVMVFTLITGVGATVSNLRGAGDLPWHLLAPESYAVEHYDVARLHRVAETGEELVLPAGDRTYRLAVTPHLLRSERFRARAVTRAGPRPIIPPRTDIFKGKVVGDPESIARLSFGREGLVAFLKSDGETRLIRPLATDTDGVSHAREATLEPHETVAVEDLVFDFQGICDAAAPAKLLPGAQGAAPSGATLAPEEAESLLVMEIALEADFEYFQTHGQNTVASVETLFNVVEGIYETELGITFEITYFEYYEEDVDPYTTNDAFDLLDELRNHWNVQKKNVPRDVVHLLTGRDLEGSTVGIAYVAEVCDLDGAYGLSQDISPTLMPVLVSHEIGHNLGAFHDPSDSVPQYIMHPSLSDATLREFSDLSRQDIEGYVAGVSCLESAQSEEEPPATSSGGGGPVDPFVLALALAIAAGLRRKGARRG